MLDMEEKRAQHEIPVLVTDAHAVHGRETCLARDTRASHGFLLAVARCVADKGQSLNHTVAMRIPVIPAFQRYRLRHGQPGRVVGWSSSATVSTTALAPSTFLPTIPIVQGLLHLSGARRHQGCSRATALPRRVGALYWRMRAELAASSAGLSAWI